jgi:hypothetical protein
LNFINHRSQFQCRTYSAPGCGRVRLPRVPFGHPRLLNFRAFSPSCCCRLRRRYFNADQEICVPGRWPSTGEQFNIIPSWRNVCRRVLFQSSIVNCLSIQDFSPVVVCDLLPVTNSIWKHLLCFALNLLFLTGARCSSYFKSEAGSFRLRLTVYQILIY